MEREIFDQNSPFIYCPHCAEKISRHVVTCPKCRTKTIKASKLPMIGFVVVGAFVCISIIGIMAAIALPAYQEYVERAESAQLELESNTEKNESVEQETSESLY